MRSLQLISFFLVVFLLSACASPERVANEDKFRKFATSMGVSESQIDESLKNTSDEELANMTQYLSEEGTFDVESVVNDMAQNEALESDKEAENLPLESITVDCELYQDPASKKYTKTLIQVKGCAQGSTEWTCKAKNNLEGTITLKLYGLRDETTPDDYSTQYGKGKLLKEFRGDVSTVLSAGREEFAFGSSPVYELDLDVEMIDVAAIEYLKKDDDADEYGRRYIRIPFIINAVLLEGDKEYLYNTPTGAYRYDDCEVITEATT